MNSWIDLHALWKIVVVGLICGAGLPAVFAFGLKALDLGQHDGDSGGTATATRNPVGIALAAVCFAVVLVAIGWGIYLIVDGT
ncbi:hypothetical protein [uncultured Jatrophihabitans sp.]|uniref:hypothetical protein n=1 Tax=uncultured Jatrophihabitans sp. TaxID=1610747 RepID=UPI0035CB0FEC